MKTAEQIFKERLNNKSSRKSVLLAMEEYAKEVQEAQIKQCADEVRGFLSWEGEFDNDGFIELVDRVLDAKPVEPVAAVPSRPHSVLGNYFLTGNSFTGMASYQTGSEPEIK